MLGGVASQLLRIVLAFSLRSLGLTVLEITVLSSTFMLARGLSAPYIGKLADRGISRLLFMALGFAGLGLDSFLYLIVPYPLMIGIRAMDGVFGAMAWTTMQAVVHLSSPRKMKGRIMSSYFMMGGLGGAVGYLMYNYFLGNIIYSVITVATLSFLNIILLYPFRGVQTAKSEEKREENRGNVGVEIYSLNFLYGMFFSLGAEVLWFYLSESMGLGKYTTTFYLSIFSLAALFGTFLMGFIADKKSYEFTLLLLGILALLSGVGLMVNSILVVLISTFVFYISGRSFLPISRSFVASKSRTLGASLGYVNLSSNLGAVISPLIGGFVYDALHSYSLFNLNLSAVSFAVLGLAIFGNTLLIKS